MLSAHNRVFPADRSKPAAPLDPSHLQSRASLLRTPHAPDHSLACPCPAAPAASAIPGTPAIAPASTAAPALSSPSSIWRAAPAAYLFTAPFPLVRCRIPSACCAASLGSLPATPPRASCCFPWPPASAQSVPSPSRPPLSRLEI